jgi:hypothetical protein
MKFKYYCQYQAEDYAKSILPVPKNYPLKKGLSKDFGQRFTKFCDLAKNIYMDMAKRPESYGLLLVELKSKDFDQIRNGFYSLRRLPDTIISLFLSGKIKNNRLTVNVETFTKQIKQNKGKTTASVSKYELVLSCLLDFGFVISDFNGKSFGKNVNSFTVEFSKDAEMINTINDYVLCWEDFNNNETNYKIYHTWEYRQYDYFDYKITANHSAIPLQQWVNDDALKYKFTPKLASFSKEFYEYSLKYKDISFNGDYYFKKKRIARINQYGCDGFGRPIFKLSVKLLKPNTCMDGIIDCSETIQEKFKKDIEGTCYKKKAGIQCAHMIKWTFNGVSHAGCPMHCFTFDDFNSKLVPQYWRLLELHFGLKKK